MWSAIQSSSRLGTLLLLCFWAPITVHAQGAGTDPATKSESLPPFEAVFGLERRLDDNLFTTPAPEFDSWITVETLGLLLSAEPGQHLLQVEYNGEFAQYQDSSDDDYDDHQLEARGYFVLGQRGELDLIGAFEQGHEMRGSGLTEGVGPESVLFPEKSDEYDSLNFRGKFRFGADNASGKLQFEAGHHDLEYQNNDDRTQFFNRDWNFVGGAYFHRISEKTFLVFDARVTDIGYDTARPTEPRPDNTENRYQLGVTWETTARTMSVAKVGFLAKNFDDNARKDFSDLSWEVDIRWSPRTYSHFDFRTARETDEPISLLVDYIDRKWFTLTWSHEWNQAWASSVTAGYRTEDYIGTAREQDRNWLGFTLNYQMRPWLGWYLGADVTTQDSKISQFEFDGNVFKIGLNVTI